MYLKLILGTEPQSSRWQQQPPAHGPTLLALEAPTTSVTLIFSKGTRRLKNASLSGVSEAEKKKNLSVCLSINLSIYLQV